MVVRSALGFASLAERLPLGRELRLLEAVVEQIPLGLMIVGSEGELLVANAEAKRIFGSHALETEDDWRGFRRDGSPYEAGDWPLVRSLRDEEVVKGERVELIRPDGKRLVVEIGSSPVRDADGKISAAVGVFRDVTDAEGRERAERDFVTNAAHQLRSPIAALSGAVEVLQAGAKEIPEDRDRFLAHLERECSRLTRATSALLTLARAQSDQEAPRLEIVELRPLLDEIAADLPARRGVRIIVECPADLVVLADRALVTEALANIAVNAARHTSKGRIRLSGRARADGVVVEVRDTGSGMPADVQERARERFYRSPSSDGAGFGLGLPIAAQALEATGASLDFASEPGRGTTVSMTFRAGRLVST